MNLHERGGNGVRVVLEWEPMLDPEGLAVYVHDTDCDFVLFPKDRAEAVEMFNHPYVYRTPSCVNYHNEEDGA